MRVFLEERDLFLRERLAGNPYQIVFFNSLDSYHKSPDSGERQHNSRTFKKRFDPASSCGSASQVDKLFLS